MEKDKQTNTCAYCEWWDAPPNPQKAGTTSPSKTGYCLNMGVTDRSFTCEKFSLGLWKDRWTEESIARRSTDK